MSSGVDYRRARPEDLPVLRRIQSEALRALAAREGRDPAAIPLTDQPSLQLQHLLQTDADLCWVAASVDRLLGFSAGFVRGDLWFLSCLYVRPEAQERGLGRQLLQHCLREGLLRGARARAVVSTTDPRAQSLYLRTGMVPRDSLFVLRGPVARILELPRSDLRIVEPDPTSEWAVRIGELDASLWGDRREAEHEFWLGEAPVACRAALGPGGELLGYAYYGIDRAGPLAARTPALQRALIRSIAEPLADYRPESYRLLVPGANTIVLRELVERGFRIDHADLLMASRRVSRLDRYLPSGGMLL